MKKLVRDITLQLLCAAVALVWLSTAVIAQSEPIVWFRGASLPAPRGSAAVSELLGTTYLLGGKGTDGATVIYFDDHLGIWKYAPPLDTAREAPGAAPVVGTGEFLVYGGRDGDPLNTSVLWTPATDTTISEANLGTGRWQVGYAVDGAGTIYAIGGRDITGSALRSVETTTPLLSSWSATTPLPAPLYGIAAVADVSGNIYVLGGTNGITVSAKVYKFTMSTKTWSTVAPLLVGVKNAGAAFASNGKLYVVGGINAAGTTIGSVQAYDPATNTWAADTALPVALSGVAVASDAEGRLKVMGGLGRNLLPVNLVYVSQFLDRPDAAPVFTSIPVTSVLEGTSYRIRVAVTANPPATLSLTSPPAGMTLSSTGLLTWTPTLAQAGTYTINVVAKNRAGSATQSFKLWVKYPPPSVPTGLQLSSEYANSAKISWAPSTSLGPGPMLYNVAKQSCVCLLSSCTCSYSTIMSGLPTPSATFYGTPKKGYTLAVSAMANGVSSQLCKGLTFTIAGPNPVTNLAQKSATSTTVTLSWTPPVAGTDPVVSYGVYQINGLSTTLLTTTKSSTGVTLTGLKASTSYSVYVIAYDNSKVGAGSTSITIATTK